MREAPLSYVFSDWAYNITCQKKRKDKKFLKYRWEKEHELEKMRSSISGKSESHLLIRNEDEIDDERDCIADPFYQYGLGIYTYLKIQRMLVRFISFMAFIALIQMAVFHYNLSGVHKNILSNDTQSSFMERLIM